MKVFIIILICIALVQASWPRGLMKLMASRGRPTPPPDGRLFGMKATTAARLMGVFVALMLGMMLFLAP